MDQEQARMEHQSGSSTDEHGHQWRWELTPLDSDCLGEPTQYLLAIQRNGVTLFDGVFATTCDRAPLTDEQSNMLDATAGAVGVARVLIPASVGQALRQAIEVMQQAVTTA